MKQFRYLPIVALLIISIISCKKSFLDDVTSKDTLYRQDYITDLKSTDEYLTGIYSRVGANLFSANHMIYPDLVADNLKPVTGSSNGATPMAASYEWNQQANEMSSGFSMITNGANCNGLSYGAYQIIRSCNFVLEKADEFQSQNPALADDMKGQAYAIRALTHFILVNFFAQAYNFTADASHPGIAYVITSNWTDPLNSRNTVAEVYAKVISDLNNAFSLIPASTSSTLTINRNAVKALLARVYLFKGDWIIAKNLAREIGIAVPIMTGVNYPIKLFTLQETEALFQIPPAVFGTNQYNTNFVSISFKTFNYFKATSDISQMLNEDPNDTRKAWVSLVSGSWNVVKFPEGIVAGINPATGSYYHSVIRSSEMYLTAAEAYAQLNNVDSARFYLDAIRKRANPTAIASTLSGAALLEAIYKERRKELAFEGLRMFDLLRWKKGVNRLDALSATVKELPYPSNKAIAPIPVLDVKVSGFTQNLDY
jgi:hypothetical protein